MKIVDAKDSIMGRVAAFVAKEALKGEVIVVINCEEVLITGNRSFLVNDLNQKRGRVGTKLAGPKISRTPEKFVKRVIRGMLPNYREGRGREALKRIKCYTGIPKEFEGKDYIQVKTNERKKYVKLVEILK